LNDIIQKLNDRILILVQAEKAEEGSSTHCVTASGEAQAASNMEKDECHQTSP
jgi:hypothetical protein